MRSWSSIRLVRDAAPLQSCCPASCLAALQAACCLRYQSSKRPAAIPAPFHCTSGLGQSGKQGEQARQEVVKALCGAAQCGGRLAIALVRLNIPSLHQVHATPCTVGRTPHPRTVAMAFADHR